VIPSRHVLDNVPTAPKVINMTSGAVCDADAQAWLQAGFRVNGYVGWMGENGQLIFNRHLRTDVYLVPGNVVGDALRRGSTVVDPDCDLYADKAALVPVDDNVRTFLASHRGQTTTASYALVERYKSSQPCNVVEVTASGPKLLESQPIEGSIIIESGSFRVDPVLGPIFYADAVGSCSPGKMTAACSLVT
jgi:hypothetical protein